MTDGALLDYYIRKNGYSFVDFSKQLGISVEALRLKRTGVNDFKTGEIAQAVKLLKLKPEEAMSIFFGAA